MNEKILFVFQGSELGGAERQGLMLARHLKEVRGAAVRVWGLGAEGSGRVTELCEEYGLPWQPVAFDWSDGTVARWRQLVSFTLKLRCARPRVVLPYTWLPNTVCGLAWRFSGAESCLWNQRDEGRGLSTGRWHRSAVRLTPHFVANATIGKEALTRLYAVPPAAIAVIHNGVSLDAPRASRSTWRRRLDIPEKGFVATMIANLHGYKDHPTLLRAWHTVVSAGRGQGRPTPTLLLAGRSDGNRGGELRVMAAALNLGTSIRFLDKVDDIAGLLLAADLCVHSSRHEGQPNGILEAMAAGLPVVASDIPGIREAVGPENHPHLAEVDNGEALAGQIRKFLGHPDVCLAVGRSNRRRVEEHFSADGMCRKMSERLGRLLDARTPHGHS